MYSRQNKDVKTKQRPLINEHSIINLIIQLADDFEFFSAFILVAMYVNMKHTVHVHMDTVNSEKIDMHTIDLTCTH